MLVHVGSVCFLSSFGSPAGAPSALSVLSPASPFVLLSLGSFVPVCTGTSRGLHSMGPRLCVGFRVVRVWLTLKVPCSQLELIFIASFSFR